MVQIVVNNQMMKRTDNEQLFNKSINYLACKFSFNSDWDNLKKYVSYNGFEVEIDDNNIALIPKDAIDEKKELIISVYGKSEDKLITTGKVVININESGYTGSEEPVQDYKDLYIKTLEDLEIANNEITSLENDKVKLEEQIEEQTNKYNSLLETYNEIKDYHITTQYFNEIHEIDNYWEVKI